MPTEAQIIAKERKALMKLMDSKRHRIPRREVDENVIIATWNIAQFSNRKKARAIRYIADICERFDIVAIQEVKTDLRGLARLQKMLPGHYKLLVSDPTGNSERMAFLYDKRTVMSTGLVCEIAFSGTIPAPTAFQLNRTPYCASFRAGRFDFTIVSVHIVEGTEYKDVGKNLRKKEIQELVEFIKSRAEKGKTAKDKAKVFDPDFFVVGDFNIQNEDDRFFKALTSKPKPKFKMPKGMDKCGTNYTRKKPYDKIAWLPSGEFELSGNFGVVPFGNVLFKEQGQEKNAARKHVSDHLPLWAEFRVKELSNELDQLLNLK